MSGVTIISMSALELICSAKPGSKACINLRKSD